MTIEWKDMGEGKRFHASIGRFAAEVSQSSGGRWFAEVGLADKRDPYWMTVILAKIGSWKDSLATADEAKRWAIEALVASMQPIVDAVRAGERERIIAALASGADKWRKGGCSQPEERALALELFAAELRKDGAR